jgi:hypothetical protein
VAEGARLESVFTGNRNVGSNPTPSASVLFQGVSLYFRMLEKWLCPSHFLQNYIS